MSKRIINHYALVLDASLSMRQHTAAVIKVTDEQIGYWAKRSTDMEQETRVSVYTFDDHVKCAIFDMDVLRLPSIASIYRPQGNTALIDATMQALLDLRKTATMYDDHAFLNIVITDGEENWSKQWMPRDLMNTLGSLHDNETVGLLVPGWRAKEHAISVGFHKGNIEVWDATSQQGVEEAMRTIRNATDNYMTARASGVKSSTGVFSMDPSTINHKTVAANLKELSGFRVEHVKGPAVIKEFVEKLGLPFITGRYYFPFIKRERINDSKEILVRHKISGKIYGGPAARQLVGLPDQGEVSVKPQENLEYDVYIQSTSNNRNLIAGHDLLIRV